MPLLGEVQARVPIRLVFQEGNIRLMKTEINLEATSAGVACASVPVYIEICWDNWM